MIPIGDPRQPLLDFLTTALPGSTMLGFDLRISTYSCAGTDLSSSTDQNPQKEECEEGYSVLLDGLWCLGHWYVRPISRELTRQLTHITRPDHLCQHSLRKEGPPRQGCR